MLAGNLQESPETVMPVYSSDVPTVHDSERKTCLGSGRVKLVAEEQGGFRKGRGCRDQIMTLMLLGQTQMAVRKAGMMAAFIDLKKAYDTVDRGKL